MQTLKYLVKHHWRALAVFVLAACLVVFFASRVVMHQVWRNDPARAEFVVKPWMTPRFVGMRMGVPPEMLFEMLDVDGRDARRMTLAQIAEQKGLPMEAVQTMLSDAAATAEAERDARRAAPPTPREEPIE